MTRHGEPIPDSPNTNGPDSASTGPTAPSLTPQLITTAAALKALLERLMAASDAAAPIALDTETTALNPFQAELVGIGLCWGDGPADLAYIPIGHQVAATGETPDLLTPPPQQLPLDQVLTALAPWLASAQHPKTLQNAKYDRLILLRHGLPLAGEVKANATQL